jgi:hypothetical protein
MLALHVFRRSEPLFSYLIARSSAPTQRRSGSSFPWQSLALLLLFITGLELIPNWNDVCVFCVGSVPIIN